jgi:hypothetical protein
MKTILLMAELWEDRNIFLWEANTKEKGYLPEQGAINPKDLGLSDHTIKLLSNWNARYSEITPEEVDTFNFIGKQLYRKLIKELQGKYHVVYYNEILAEVIDENEV